MSIFKSHSGYQGVHRARERHRISAALIALETLGGFRVKYRSSHSEGDYDDGEILSLSTAGLFIRTRTVPEKDALVFINFHFRKQQVKCIGRVIYTHRRKEATRAQGFGVRFTRLAEPDLQRINKEIEDFYKAFSPSVS